MRNTSRMVNEAERNAAAKMIARSDAFSERVLKEGESARAGFDTLSYLDNGKKVTVEVSELVAREMKNLNSVLPNWADTTMRIVGAPTRALRAGATAANPLFALSNVVRDQLQTLITGDSKLGLIGNAGRNIKGTPKAFMAALAPGETGKALRAELSRNGVIGSEYRQTYGYKSGQLAKELQAESKLPQQAIQRLIHPINSIADLIGRTEYFTRAQQFYGTPGDITARTQAARNNTLNFSRGGVLVRQLNKVIPFLNAGVQGGRITVKSLKERPIQTVSSLATLTGIALAAKAMNQSQNQELWDRMSDEEKKQNLIIFSPDARYDPETNRIEGVIKIPMPQMTYPFLDAANNVTGKGEDVLTLAADVFTATTGLAAPVEDGKFDSKPTMNQLTPTAVKPFAEAGLNKSFYTGNDLVSEYEKNLNPEDKGKKYSTGVARGVSKVTGIDAPVIDNFIGAWGGGLAKDTAKGFSDNPDNNKDGGGPMGALKEGYGRRFTSAGVTSQYDMQSKNAKSYKDALKSNDVFKSMSAEEQAKVLDKIDTDTMAIAGIASKTEQNKSGEIKRDLTSRQKKLVENGFDASQYLKDSSSKVADTKLSKETGAYKFLDNLPEMDDTEKASWKSQKVSQEHQGIIDAVNKSLPEGLPKFEGNTATNAVAELYANYQKDRADKGWSDLQAKREGRKLIADAYKTQLSDNERFITSLSDKDILSAAENGEIGKEEMDNIIKVDNILVKLGLTQIIGNKTRSALGYAGNYKSGGSKKVGKKARSGGGRKGKGSKKDYKLFGFQGTDSASVGKNLRKLIENAMA